MPRTSTTQKKRKYERPVAKTARSTTINRDGPESLYLQIASQIAEEIAEGKHVPYSRLSSEYELMKRFNVSRTTVRLAIHNLVHRNLVVSRQGKGTYVAGPVLHYPLQRLTGFYDTLVSQGVQPETRLLEFGPTRDNSDPASADPAYQDLSITLRRLYRRNGQPIALMHAFLPAAAMGIGRERAAEHTVYSILQDLLGITVERAEVSIRARQADGEIGEHLGLGKEMPVLVMERVSYTRNDRACERSFFYVQPEAYEFTLGVQGPLEITSKISRISKAM